MSLPLVATLAVALLLSTGRAGGQTAPTPPAAPATPATAAAVVVRGAAVFDGQQLRPDTDVLLQAGRIARVGAPGVRLPVPAGTEEVPGRGRTLLPGLIDAHTHSWGPARRDALRLGVSTELEMFGDAAGLPAARRERESLAPTAQADLWSAGVLATVPRGHGTQFGMRIPTLTEPGQATAFVQARVAEGSDYLKIVIEDGSAFGQSTPSLNGETVAALAGAARAAGKLAVAHVSTVQDAGLALRGGVQGLVHIPFDRSFSPEWLAQAKERGLFVVPTLSVLASVAGDESSRQLAGDAGLAPWLSAEQAQQLRAPFPAGWQRAQALDRALANVRALQAAGIPVLAGTDAGNPGTAHGASMHGELALLVRAGLTPLQALQAATAGPARAFGLADRGRIAEGLRADLLLVDGDPTQDITRTRAIVTVWKNGAAVPRERVGEQAAALASAPAPADPVLADFEAGTPTARGGQPWMPTTDAMAGGKSSTTLSWSAGGAQGSRGALRVQGTVDPGLPFAWAGAMHLPGPQPFEPVDFSSRNTLVFQVRGEAPALAVMLFSGAAMQSRPSVVPFAATAEWREVRIPLQRFRGADVRLLRGLAFTAGPAAGRYSFEIDDIRLE